MPKFRFLGEIPDDNLVQVKSIDQHARVYSVLENVFEERQNPAGHAVLVHHPVTVVFNLMQQDQLLGHDGEDASDHDGYQQVSVQYYPSLLPEIAERQEHHDRRKGQKNGYRQSYGVELVSSVVDVGHGAVCIRCVDFPFGRFGGGVPIARFRTVG